MSALVALAMTALAGAAPAADAPPLPRPPALPAPLLEGHVAYDGALIWFATFGDGPPVILLHGAGGDSDNFGFQVPALVADHHRVIVIDSRGQGRSTMGPGPLGYERMESDVIAVMDQLQVRKASFVGWSDGGILSLIVAMKHPDRADRIFAFGADMDVKGLNPNWMATPLVAQALAWAKEDYARLSPTPNDFDKTFAAIATMAETQPNYAAADLARIHGPAIAIVDGATEELILPEHTRYLARTIPHAQLVLLPGVGHGAPVQAPDAFNKAMLAFLDRR
ncbi:MAG TPA: alpha/beta hydrolase [Caulobacteraceae bacterium]|nr:alpha/beta hydrolase [Caulobacteraceae bacterium]